MSATHLQRGGKGHASAYAKEGVRWTRKVLPNNRNGNKIPNDFPKFMSVMCNGSLGNWGCK
eukprot:3676976-Amphidinium_carterae.1